MEVNPTALSVSTRLFLSWVETFFALLVAGKKKLALGLFRREKRGRGGKKMDVPDEGGEWVGGVSNEEDLTFGAFVECVVAVEVAGSGDFPAYRFKKE